jgi:hypothetical protein
MTLYIHHVPGRLRLQTMRLREDGPAAQAACDAAIQIAGVTEARANSITGSLIISYDREHLAPSALWEQLCALGLASGPLPIQDGAPVTRGVVQAKGAVGSGLIDVVAGVLLEKLVERSAMALLGALI